MDHCRRSYPARRSAAIFSCCCTAAEQLHCAEIRYCVRTPKCVSPVASETRVLTCFRCLRSGSRGGARLSYTQMSFLLAIHLWLPLVGKAKLSCIVRHVANHLLQNSEPQSRTLARPRARRLLRARSHVQRRG
eukprot:4195990-Pleurochrysis_carterae.AAC.1